MRIWFKEFKENRLVADTTITDTTPETRTHKVFGALDEACYQLDLAKPIWLDKNIAEFQRHSKVKFYQDSFIEELPFDYLEMHVIEED